MGFLVIGYAHENIDTNSGYLSKTLREQNNCVSRFDEIVYSFAKATIHSQTNSKNPKFQILGQGCLKNELEYSLDTLIFYGFFGFLVM